MDIKISSQPALIGLNIEKPAIKLDIKPPDTEIKASVDQVEIEASDPKVQIDLTQCHQDAGYFKPVAMINKAVQEAQADGLQGIAKIAGKGDRLADISSGTTVVAVISSEVRAENQVDYNVAAVPKHPPIITAYTYPLELNLNEGKLQINPSMGEIRNLSNWSRVGMYLLQKPSIDVQWTGSYFDAIA